MNYAVAILILVAGCNAPPARHDAWPQPAGIDAPSWPAASNTGPLNQRLPGNAAGDRVQSRTAWAAATADQTNTPASPLPQGDAHQGPVQTPSTERMAKSHLATGESHSSAGVSLQPDSPSVRTDLPAATPVEPIATAVSSFPAVPPADAGATLLPVAPRRLLVLFTMPKCAPCDDLKRLLAQCESQVYGDFIFREVDITTFDVGLNSAPWLALFDAGTEKQIEGPTAAPKTLGGLKELLTRWGTL